MGIVKKVLKALCCVSLFVLSATSVRAAGMLHFNTSKPWTTGRWYVLGKVESTGAVMWLGGGKSAVKNLNTGCFSEKFHPQRLNDKEALDANGDRLELLKGANQWFALEVNPDRPQEGIEIAFGSQAACRGQIRFKVAFGTEGGGPKPFLFLKAEGNEYFGYTIDFAGMSAERAHIQLDLLMGYWRATLNNAEAGASNTITLAPTAVARGEWLMPFWKRMGLLLELEQTVINTGGVTVGANNQNVLFSDWTAGAFVQFFVPILDGVQLRGHVKFHQHLAYDGEDIVSVAAPNLDARYLQVGGTMNFYLWRRWLLGGDLEYGLPNTMSGTVSQSYLGWVARTGVRLTSSLTILLETGVRSYRAEGYEAESILQVQTGIRLGL